ncbi:hypothetical protein [Streptomyces sp. NRRL B-1347]|uniref:hypothetical protein n=1 Tax=Streptomyces sp. NRRL B-1347 TaxID=1476877 RepID=UPI0004C4C7BA|nr:hypothetical protein [Streptomyces sp. NRRL B-1347]
MSCPLISNVENIRVTRVDSCGRPVCGADNAFVLECLASVSMSPDVEEGEDIEYKAANGKVCGFKRGCPSFRGYEVEVNFFSVSPEFVEITTGNPVVFGFDGQPIGHDDCSVQCNIGFALELWAPILGDDICDASGLNEGKWIYMLLPWITNGVLGDLEAGSEAVTLVLQGATRSGGGWGIGPYDVLEQDAALTPGPLLTPLGNTCHRRVIQTQIAPPTPGCDYVDVTGGVCLAS